MRSNPLVSYWGHKTYADMRMQGLGLEEQGLPEWGLCGMENLTLTPHAGSYMDAPWHYGLFSEGKPARTIDQILLEWCYSYATWWPRKRGAFAGKFMPILSAINVRLEAQIHRCGLVVGK